MTICKTLIKKPFFFCNGFRGFLSYMSQIFLIYLNLTMKRWPFKVFANFHFVYLFFLLERNIATSLLIMYLKYTVVHCDNLNSSSINKPYLRAVQYTTSFVFFNFLFMFILTRLLSKTL